MAFNSARGGYVAIDDVSFSPEFCQTDTGERRHFRRLETDHNHWLLCISILVQFGWLFNMLKSKSEVLLVATGGCNVNYTSQCKIFELMEEYINDSIRVRDRKFRISDSQRFLTTSPHQAPWVALAKKQGPSHITYNSCIKRAEEKQ